MTAPIELPPDAEDVAVTYLSAALAARPEAYAADVTVSTKLPPGRSPTRHVRLRRLGGTPYSRVQDSPRIQAQVWHETGTPVTDELNRNALAMLTWALLHAIRGKVVIIGDPPVPITCYRVLDVGGPYNGPDPADDTRTITTLTVEIGMRIRAA